jgi:hypothetical protein
MGHWKMVEMGHAKGWGHWKMGRWKMVEMGHAKGWGHWKMGMKHQA